MLTYEKICDMFLTYRIKLKKITEEINEYLLPYDISMQHAVYIMALSCYGDMTIKELNANVDNDGAITTRVVKKLKKEGYVKKLGKMIKKYENLDKILFYLLMDCKVRQNRILEKKGVQLFHANKDSNMYGYRPVIEYRDI